jgi:DNA-binding IclR family transcriptional regulator
MEATVDTTRTDGHARGRYEVAVVANALDLLVAIGQQPGSSLTTAEASRILGISRSTAYRLLVTMASRGFVEHDSSTRGWTLGMRLLALARLAKNEKLHQIALFSMRRLLEQEGETVNLAAFTGSELIYIETLESPHAFRMTEAPGEVAPLHATALGKAVLAALPEDDRASLLAHLDLRPLTDRTVCDRVQLEVQLRETSARGWSLEEGEAEAGVSCLGAAILDANRLPIGALSVSVPNVRLDPKRAGRIGQLVSAEAAETTSRLSTTLPSKTTAAGEVSRSQR